jgi:hypothetical protein
VSNQVNVHFINQEKMLAAKVGDVFSDDPYETSLPVEGAVDEPLLQFLRESLARIGEEDEDLLDDIEQYELLSVVQDEWDPEAATWVITFETSWAMEDDLMVVRKHVEGPVKERLPGLQNLEAGEFPATIPATSPFRAFDVSGWQFFDKEEFDNIVQGVLRAKEATDGVPGNGLLHEEYEEEWDYVIKTWQNGGYDLVLLWWLM